MRYVIISNMFMVPRILSQVQSTLGGKVSDSRFIKRMLGEGKIAELASKMMQTAKKKHLKRRGFPDFDNAKFRRGGMYIIW